MEEDWENLGIGEPEQQDEEVKVDFNLKKLRIKNPKTRKIVCVTCMLIALAVTLFIFFNRDELFKQTISFSDGCEEVYDFSGNLLTEECTNAREMIEQQNQMSMAAPTISEIS